MPCGATQDGQVMVERSDRMWSTGGWEDVSWVLNTLLTFHGPQARDSISISASLCLCLCLSLFSRLLLAPVDIKVIKDLPWPPPVGQLDSSPSLPTGDRDISGPASPIPEPSQEDGSGGSRGGFWRGPARRPRGIGWEELRGGVEFREPRRNASGPGGRGKGQRTRSSLPKAQGRCLLREAPSRYLSHQAR